MSRQRRAHSGRVLTLSSLSAVWFTQPQRRQAHSIRKRMRPENGCSDDFVRMTRFISAMHSSQNDSNGSEQSVLSSRSAARSQDHSLEVDNCCDAMPRWFQQIINKTNSQCYCLLLHFSCLLTARADSVSFRNGFNACSSRSIQWKLRQEEVSVCAEALLCLLVVQLRPLSRVDRARRLAPAQNDAPTRVCISHLPPPPPPLQLSIIACS